MAITTRTLISLHIFSDTSFTVAWQTTMNTNVMKTMLGDIEVVSMLLINPNLATQQLFSLP